jgi:type IV secretion/conjugal transfer VirB4 family ATPase
MTTLTALILTISLVGLVLVGLLYVRLRQVDRILQLKRHRAQDEALCDLLNYAAVVDDGVVIGKNGALIAGWEYTGADNASVTDQARDVVSARLNQALARLGTGWMLHVDAVRCPANPYSGRELSHFPDPVSRAIDEERRAFFAEPGAAYESRFVICVSYLPPDGAIKKLSEIIYDDDQHQRDPKVEAANTLALFERELTALENRLSSSFQLRRLGARTEVTEDGREVEYDDLLSHFQYCVTGIRQPIRLPRTPIYLDAIIGGQELHGGVLPRIGRKYLQIVAIEGFPADSFAGMLTSLGELPIEYRWSTRYIFLEGWEALSHIERFRKKWKQQVIPFLAQVLNLKTDNINEDAASMVTDASAAKLGISGGVVSAGYYTVNLLFFDEDRRHVEHSARVAEKVINNLGFTARIETINTMDAWLGSLPGHGVENVRRPLVNTMNLADLLPVSSIWTGENKAPCPFYPEGSPPLMHVLTTGGTPFHLNLHVRDIGSTLVFGPTHTGKSSFLGANAAQLRRYPGMTLYCFDKGMSMYTYCTAAGGTHYNVAGDDETLSFCPLQYLDTDSDRSWAAEWLEQICALNGLLVTPAQRNEIGRSIKSLHQRKHTSLTDFCSTVQDNAIREVLNEYTLDGSKGRLFDAQEDTLGLDAFTVFEVEELMNLAPKYGLPILIYLFRRIERSLRGQPAAIFLDEAWLMLSHPVFRDKIKEWLRVLRKANCLVLMATQSLSDAINSGILDIIKDSTATKIFLPNPNAKDEDGGALYRRFGLNDREIEIIAGATPKRDYYYKSDEHQRLFDLALGPLALAFVGVSDKESVAQVKRCQERFGKQWVNEWLRHRGLTLSEYIGEQAPDEEKELLEV